MAGNVLREVIDAAIESDDVGALGPLVEALVIHHIRQGDTRALRQLAAREHFRMSLVDALRRRMDRGDDVRAALPLLLERRRTLDDTDVKRLLVRYVKSRPRAVEEVVETLLAQRWGGLPDLVSDLVREKVDVHRQLPALAALLDARDRRLRFDVACMYRLAAEGGQDVTPALPLLATRLDDPSGDVRARLAYAIAFTLAARPVDTPSYNLKGSAHKAPTERCGDGDASGTPTERGRDGGASEALGERGGGRAASGAQSERGGGGVASGSPPEREGQSENTSLASLQHHADAKVRLGAVWALSVLLNSRGGLPSPLACALLDDDPEVRGDASRGLAAARRRGVFTRADDPTLRHLAAHASTSEATEYLYLCALDDPALAGMLAPLVPRTGESGYLAEALDELAAGTHAHPCPLCSMLPRRGWWSHESEVPPEVARLEGRGELRRCPSCSQVYAWWRTEDWDDMTVDVTISLERLPPDVLLTRLVGAPLAALRRDLPTLLDRWRRCLRSPLRWLREDAAWVLTREALSKRDDDEVRRLLGDTDDAVGGEALRTLMEAAPAQAVERLEESLRPLIGHRLADRRRRAASLLTTAATRHGRTSAVADLLRSSDPQVLAGILGALADIDDPSPYAGRLEALATHPEAAVRHAAARLRSRLAPRSSEAEGVDDRPSSPDGASHDDRPGERGSADAEVSRLVRMLSNPLAAVRAEAASALSAAAAGGRDVTAAVPSLLDMVPQRKAGWAALKALEAASAAGADVRSAVPAMIRLLARRRYPYKPEALRILSGAWEQGADLTPAWPVVAPCLQRPLTRSDALQLVERALAKGADIGAAEAALRDLFDLGDAYTREKCAALVTRLDLGRGRFEDVAALLAHPRHGVRYGTASAIEAWAAGAARAPHVLTPALQARLSDPQAVVRNAAARALAALAARHPSTDAPLT